MRGLGRATGHWGDFVERFHAGLPDDALEPFDLPGCGARAAESAPLSVGANVEAVREARGGREPVWLLGLSLGGMVAYEWLRRHPEEVAGAVLVNTSLGGLSPPWRRLRPSAIARLAAAVATRDPLARERVIFGLTSNHPELAESTVTRWAALARREPVRLLDVLRQLLAAATYRARPLHTSVPILLLAGRGDRMVSPSCARAIAASVSGAKLSEHPTAGHDLPLDDPDWVLGEIAEWLPPRNRTKLLQA